MYGKLQLPKQDKKVQETPVDPFVEEYESVYGDHVLDERSALYQGEAIQAVDVAGMLRTMEVNIEVVLEQHQAMAERAAVQERNEQQLDLNQEGIVDHLRRLHLLQNRQNEIMAARLDDMRQESSREIATLGQEIRREFGLVRGDVQAGNQETQSMVHQGIQGVHEQVAAVGEDVAEVGRDVNSGFSRMDQGFNTMNEQFRELNANIRRYSSAPRNTCFDMFNYESIPQVIIKFFKCLLALFVFLLTIAKLMFDILRELRTLFYSALQDATRSIRPFDTAVKLVMYAVELNFYAFVLDTLGTFFGVKRLDRSVITGIAKFTVGALNFLYREIVRTATETRLSQLLGDIKTEFKKADPVVAVCDGIQSIQQWYFEYVTKTQTKFREEIKVEATKLAEQAATAAVGQMNTIASRAAEATGIKAATDLAYKGLNNLAKASGFTKTYGGRLQYYGGHGELQMLKFLHTNGDNKRCLQCLQLVSNVFRYMERNIRKPDEELIAYVRNPLVQERIKLIQQLCIGIFPSKKGGRKTHRRKRSKRIKIRSKKYN